MEKRAEIEKYHIDYPREQKVAHNNSTYIQSIFSSPVFVSFAVS